MTLQAASAASVDPRKIADDLFAGRCVTGDIDILVERWSPEKLATFIEFGRELIDKPEAPGNAEFCYAVAKACLRQNADAQNLLHLDVRLVFVGFYFPINTDPDDIPDDRGMMVETLDLPRSAVSQEDIEMLNRLTSLRGMCMDFWTVTPVKCFSTPEEALKEGHTRDTERLMILLGREDKGTVLSDHPGVTNKWHQYASRTMMSFAPWFPLPPRDFSQEDDLIDVGARITLEDLPTGMFQTFILRYWYYEEYYNFYDSGEESSAQHALIPPNVSPGKPMY